MGRRVLLIAGLAPLIPAARVLGADSAWFAVVVVWWPMTWVGTMSRLVRIRLPERWYRLRSFERDGVVYERLGVRVVKTLARRGPISWWNPGLRMPAERTPERLERLADGMRAAEASHALLFAATLPVVAHAAVRGWWTAAALTLLLDVVLNGCPVLLQRYNRARLAERFVVAHA